MRKVSIVYFDDLENVDIILVPNWVHDNIHKVLQQFNDYASSTTEHGWFVELNGERVLSTGTGEFLQWINKNYFYLEQQESVLVVSNTKFTPKYRYVSE
jgi:hypothetical protein